MYCLQLRVQTSLMTQLSEHMQELEHAFTATQEQLRSAVHERTAHAQHMLRTALDAVLFVLLPQGLVGYSNHCCVEDTSQLMHTP